MPRLTIDMVSDTVCPWCMIGKRHVEKALADRTDNLSVQWAWHPYQLHPQIPAEGVDRETFVAQKFGSKEKARALYAHVRQAGQSAGLDFRFDLIKRTINTVDSHRLIRWSRNPGCQDQVVEALFAAFFFDGRDISDHAVLTDIATQAGMDGALVSELLKSDRDKDMVVQEASRAGAMGITGVPFIILNGKLAVPGAQDPATINQAIDQAVAG